MNTTHPLDISVEPGGEGYVKWAKARLHGLRGQRKDLGLPVMRKNWQIDSSTRVDLTSADYGDKIRITAGSRNRLYLFSGFGAFTDQHLVGFSLGSGTTNPVEEVVLTKIGNALSFKTDTKLPAFPKLGFLRRLLKAKSRFAQDVYLPLIAGLNFKTAVGGAPTAGFLPEQVWKSTPGNSFLVQVKELPDGDFLLLVYVNGVAGALSYTARYMVNGGIQSSQTVTPIPDAVILFRLSELERVERLQAKNEVDPDGYVTIQSVQYVPFVVLNQFIGASVPTPGSIVVVQTGNQTVTETSVSTPDGSGGFTFPVFHTSITHGDSAVTKLIQTSIVAASTSIDLYSPEQTLGGAIDSTSSSNSNAQYTTINGLGTSSGSSSFQSSSEASGGSVNYLRELTEAGVVLSDSPGFGVPMSDSFNSHTFADSVFAGGQGGGVFYEAYDQSVFVSSFSAPLTTATRGERIAAGSISSPGGSFTDNSSEPPGIFGIGTFSQGVGNTFSGNAKFFTKPDLVIDIPDTGNATYTAGRENFPLTQSFPPSNLSTMATTSSRADSGVLILPSSAEQAQGIIQKSDNTQSINHSYTMNNFIDQGPVFMSCPTALSSSQIVIYWPKPLSTTEADGVCYVTISNVALWNSLRVNTLGAQITNLVTQIALLSALLSNPAFDSLHDLILSLIATSQAQLDVLLAQQAASAAAGVDTDAQMDALMTIHANNFASKALIRKLAPTNQTYFVVDPLRP